MDQATYASQRPHCPLVALTMIVKDEARNLPACLASVADLVDERIIVDTGSTDQTVEIARSFGATVISSPWADSFAAARNVGLQHATAQWVFWMDADEYLAEPDRRRMKTLRHRLEAVPNRQSAYVMACRCQPSNPNVTATLVDHVRLFCSDPRHRWQYRVHEQINPCLRDTGTQLEWTDVVIQHTGYLDQTRMHGKWDRNQRLMELDLADNPGDPHILLHLGMVHRERGTPARALPYLSTALEHLKSDDSLTAVVRMEYARCCREAGDIRSALEAVVAGRQHHPHSAELLSEECEIRWQLRDWPATERCLIELMNRPASIGFRCGLEGQHTVIARHKLAVLRLEQGRWDEAERLWQQVLLDSPSFLQAQRGLQELARRRKT